MIKVIRNLGDQRSSKFLPSCVMCCLKMQLSGSVYVSLPPLNCSLHIFIVGILKSNRHVARTGKTRNTHRLW